jgi:coenzyme F420-0:L-glutamate ligase
MELLPLKSGILKNRFNLLETIKETLGKHHCRLRDCDIIVVSSKVLALSQGRIVDLREVRPTAAAKKINRTRYGTAPEDLRVAQLILQEADKILPGKMFLTLKDNVLVPSAGVDLSNAGKNLAITWPKNPWSSARKLCKELKTAFRLKNVGVVISDSVCQPLRWGVTGVAIAWAGFEGVEDCRGQKDLFGKLLKVTKKACADNLASAAHIVMGEAAEKIPFVLIKNAPVNFTNRIQKAKEIFPKPSEDIFAGIYNEESLKLFKKAFKNKLS